MKILATLPFILSALYAMRVGLIVGDKQHFSTSDTNLSLRSGYYSSYFRFLQKSGRISESQRSIIIRHPEMDPISFSPIFEFLKTGNFYLEVDVDIYGTLLLADYLSVNAKFYELMVWQWNIFEYVDIVRGLSNSSSPQSTKVLGSLETGLTTKYCQAVVVSLNLTEYRDFLESFDMDDGTVSFIPKTLADTYIDRWMTLNVTRVFSCHDKVSFVVRVLLSSYHFDRPLLDAMISEVSPWAFEIYFVDLKKSLVSGSEEFFEYLLQSKKESLCRYALFGRLPQWVLTTREAAILLTGVQSSWSLYSSIIFRQRYYLSLWPQIRNGTLETAEENMLELFETDIFANHNFEISNMFAYGTLKPFIESMTSEALKTRMTDWMYNSLSPSSGDNVQSYPASSSVIQNPLNWRGFIEQFSELSYFVSPVWELEHHSSFGSFNTTFFDTFVASLEGSVIVVLLKTTDGTFLVLRLLNVWTYLYAISVTFTSPRNLNDQGVQWSPRFRSLADVQFGSKNDHRGAVKDSFLFSFFQMSDWEMHRLGLGSERRFNPSLHVSSREGGSFGTLIGDAKTIAAVEIYKITEHRTYV